jgi:hypothetical protein
MGSKRWMLANGLGHLLRDETSKPGLRFFDLFAGSGAVASFVAQKSDVEVHAFDLQTFCISLCEAVITRTSQLEPSEIWPDWSLNAQRYPPPSERPRSKYSVGSESRAAVADLLQSVAMKGATAIVTFPDKKCSNGISSYHLEETARKHFRSITRKTVRGRFSTLGGNGDHRDARQPSSELILLLRP